jgi:hypothetical protein
MAEGKRFGLSTMQKSDLWFRWKAGQSLHEIGRVWQDSFVNSPGAVSVQPHRRTIRLINEVG